MVIDEAGGFIAARTDPKLLSLLTTPGTAGRITLTHHTLGAITVDPASGEDPINVQVWGHECQGLMMDQEVNAWLSDYLGKACGLVYMPDEARRAIHSDAATPADIVSYADGFPILVTTESSLEDLNTRISPAIEMSRFRPNLVIAGAHPFEELDWLRIRIGELELVSGGPCVRCVLTTRDPLTGERRSDGEPLKTLAQYQKIDGGTVFGINMIPRTQGHLNTGDPVVVLERQ